MIRIDFNELIEKYDTNLLDNLRGFGTHQEYLKFWVPGTTVIKSFENLVDSFIEIEKLNFVVLFNKDIFKENFFNEIDIFLKKIGTYKIEINKNLISYNIIIDQILYKSLHKENKFFLEKKDEIKIDQKKQILVYKSEHKLNPNYLYGLEKILPNNYFKEKIKQEKNIYKKKIEDIYLYFVIDNNIIIKLFHDCKSDTSLKKLVNIFFDLCINKNIQEAADHSIIYLEEKIRLINKILPKTGIILPSHAGTYFDDLNTIIREVFFDYKNKESIKFEINRHYFKKSYNWIHLNESEKIKKINIIIEEILKKNYLNINSAKAISIENNFKVNLDIDKFFKTKQEKTNLLLEIERKIKILDETLEVFISESLDKNKIRIKNSPQTKLLN